MKLKSFLVAAIKKKKSKENRWINFNNVVYLAPYI